MSIAADACTLNPATLHHHLHLLYAAGGGGDGQSG